MTRLRSGLVRLTADARNAFRSAPLEVALTFLAAALFSFVLEADEPAEPVARLLVAIGLALPAVHALTLLYVHGSVSAVGRWTLSAAVLALAVLYAFPGFEPERGAELWRLGLLATGSALLPFAAPAALRHADRDWTWQAHARLLARIVTAGAYGHALFLGIALAIVSIEQLFELRIDRAIFGHLAGWIFIAIVPWIVAGGAAAVVRPASALPDLARRLTRLAAALLVAPLVLGYIAILYAYTVRIGITGEVPKNLLSPLVAGAAALWVLAVFLIEPLRDDDARGLTRLVRALPVALLPLIGLGLWAVGIRIDQYGWTEFRYIRVVGFVALAALAAAGIVRLLRRRRPLPWAAVPGVFAIAAFLAAVGPWGAPAVTRRSQYARLEQAIERAWAAAGEAAGASQATGARPVPPELYDGINGTARYLVAQFGPASVADIAPFDTAVERWVWGQFADSLGFTRGAGVVPIAMAIRVGAVRPDTAVVHGLIGGSLYPVHVVADTRSRGVAPLRVSGCETAVAWEGRAESPRLEPVEQALPGVVLVFEPRADRLRVRPLDGRPALTADLRPLAEAVSERFGADCRRPPHVSAAETVLDVRDDAGRRRGQLLVDEIRLLLLPPADSAGSGRRRPVVESVRGHLLLSL